MAPARPAVVVAAAAVVLLRVRVQAMAVLAMGFCARPPRAPPRRVPRAPPLHRPPSHRPSRSRTPRFRCQSLWPTRQWPSSARGLELSGGGTGLTPDDAAVPPVRSFDGHTGGAAALGHHPGAALGSAPRGGVPSSFECDLEGETAADDDHV